MMELIVVMSLLAIITAAVVPVYSASLPGIQIRTARAEIVSVILAAQENAVRESRTHRVYISKREGTYWIMAEYEVPEDMSLNNSRGQNRRNRSAFDDTYFEYIDERWGALRELPSYLELSRSRARADSEFDAYYIECKPNGACDQATFRFRDTRRGGDSFVITTLGTLGKISDE